MGQLKAYARRVLPDWAEIHAQALNHYWAGEPELRLVKKLCDPTRPAIDIGANIGTYTYFLRRHASEVICFEPNPLLARRLQKIFPTVDVRAKALSDSASDMDLRVPIIHGRETHELASITQDFPYADRVRKYRVPVVTLDEEDIHDVGFMKVDVEQNELPALQGGLQTIRRCRPTIMAEVNPLLYQEGMVNALQFILQDGYCGWFTFEGKRYPFSQFDAALHANRELYRKRFMNPNIFLIPAEIDGSTLLTA